MERPKRQAKASRKYDDDGELLGLQQRSCLLGFLPESAHAHSCCVLSHDPDFVIPEEAAKMYWEANSRKVYRVLTHKDIKNSLKDTDVYILWPDDGVWYMAEVEQVGRDVTFL
jgi:hypothetical protein